MATGLRYKNISFAEHNRLRYLCALSSLISGTTSRLVCRPLPELASLSFLSFCFFLPVIWCLPFETLLKMASAADAVDALLASAPRDALESLLKAAVATGTLSLGKLREAVEGNASGPAKKRVLGVIPARYGSTRFPGKPLAVLGGRPMIWVRASAHQHLY